MTYRWTMEDVAKLTGRRRLTELPTGPQVQSQSKRPKYGNRKVTDATGAVHDSGKEFRRWQELQLRERAGEITKLRRQVPFACVVNGILVCQYVADVVYEESAALVVEDCKSEPTRKLAAYRIKAKLMAAIHGIQVREV